MVHKEVLRHFVIAVQHLENAKFAGSPRHAIAEGYSAIDSCFSALLIDYGQTPSRNHKHKLDSVKNLYPQLLDDYRELTQHSGLFHPGVPWKNIEAFYRAWLSARYEVFLARPIDARIRWGEAQTVVEFGMRSVGKKHAFPAFGFEDKVRTLAFGYVFSKTDTATSDLTERRCEEAERYGELYGFPLGARIAETSNYCALAITANDEATRKIIKTDTLIADECTDVYERFIKLVEHIQARRRVALTPADVKDPKQQEEPDETPDFMLALKMSFHGQKLSEWIRWLSRS